MQECLRLLFFGIDDKNEMTMLMDGFRGEINRVSKTERPKILFFMGKNPEGGLVWGDFATINHLLISGVTGFGKSHLLNTIMLSALFLSHPNEVKITVFDIKGFT